MASRINEIKRLLERCSRDQRYEVFRALRAEFRIHPLEEKLNAQAEIILEAISRASDLTLRGIRGIIAEAAFAVEVVGQLEGWENTTPAGDHPFDFRLNDGNGDVRVQVKMQRLRAHRPMLANEGYKFLPSDMYVVETQRTRGGRDPRTNSDTRPYRFGEFDILAVSMHPSTNNWSRFMYTAASWLLPRPSDRTLLLKFQPVARVVNDDWTDDFLTCVSWFRSKVHKHISPGAAYKT